MIGKQRSTSSGQQAQMMKDAKDSLPPPRNSTGRYEGRTLSPSLNPLEPPCPPPQTTPHPQVHPGPANENLLTRLKILLDSVISILNSKSLPPNPRTHSLHIFYHRLVDLLHSPSPLDEGVVDDLEREWWGSEIVAAWYGPTRALRERGGLVAGGGGAGGVRVKADMMYVGLHDE
jgi:hypothetical protein